jgi:hypothetical protein
MSKTPHVLLWVTLLLFPLHAHAQGEQWQVGTTPSFSSGRYGTSTRTEVFHTPVIARRLFDNGDFTLVVPYTCIRGNGSVVIVNGMPVRQERLDAAQTDMTSRTSIDSARSATTTATAQPVRHCGLGDVVVRGRYYAIDERSWIPTIAVRAHVKIPTASEERGLGTGRPDEGVGVEITRTIGRGLMAMVDGGYTIVGDRAADEFNNNWWYDVGVGQDLATGVVNLSVFLEEYRALVPGIDNAREVLAAVSLKSTNGWRVQISGALGLSDGAPDHGLTVGASRRF